MPIWFLTWFLTLRCIWLETILISQLNYCLGKLLGDHHCVVLICISTVQYITIQSVLLFQNVLSSTDSRTISSIVSSGQKLVAVIGYLDNSLVLNMADDCTINLQIKGSIRNSQARIYELISPKMSPCNTIWHLVCMESKTMD